MFELDVAETVELLLVTVSNKAKRIEEAKRRLGTEFAVEGHVEGRGGGLLGDGGECGGTGEEGCNNRKLHLDLGYRYSSLGMVSAEERTAPIFQDQPQLV